VATDKGWIKLYRQLLNKAIWQCSTMEQKVILITLLLMANHEEKEWEWQGEKFKCKPGQFVTSLKSIAEKAGSDISIQNVRTAIAKFEKYEFLTNQSTKTGRLITIVNWELYQSQDSKLTKGLTKHQQSANKALTTNKNDKNDKKNNPPIVPPVKKSYAEFVTMTEDEYKKLLTKYGKEKTVKMIEILDNYKGASGKKYKSDYRAILNWVVKRVEQEEQQERKGGYVSGKKRLSRQDDRDWEGLLGID
jgi:hypothetical protein